MTASHHWGDLMGPTPLPLISGLEKPLERIIATANGNLQRIVSSWSNQKVSVIVKQNIKDQSRYRRSVDLSCGGKVFAHADSVVTLSDAAIVEAVESGRVGLGQVFRQFDLLPAFELQSVCVLDGSLERRYVLKSSGIRCDISEIIDLNCIGNVASQSPISAEVEDAHFGDIMCGTTVQVMHSQKYTPFERVLLSCNGNVVRVLSSFVNSDLWVNIVEDGNASKHRRVLIQQGDVVLCCAESAIDTEIECDDYGNLFGAPGEEGSILPHFELLQAFKNEHLHRTYLLTGPQIRITVHETFYFTG